MQKNKRLGLNDDQDDVLVCRLAQWSSSVALISSIIVLITSLSRCERQCILHNNGWSSERQFARVISTVTFKSSL